MNDEIEQQLIVVMVAMLSECWRYESGSLWCVPLAVLPALVVLAVRVLRRRKKNLESRKKKALPHRHKLKVGCFRTKFSTASAPLANPSSEIPSQVVFE